MSVIVNVLLSVVTVVACYTDLKSGQIKNTVTYPLIICGVLLTFFEINRVDLFEALMFTVVSLIMLVSFYKSVVGGGDIKLIFGVQLCALPYYGISLIFFIFLFGFIASILMLSFRREEYRFGPVIMLATIFTIIFY